MPGKVYKFVTVFTEKLYQALDLSPGLLYYILVKVRNFACAGIKIYVVSALYSPSKGKNFKWIRGKNSD